jgi:hypothetical protein
MSTFRLVGLALAAAFVIHGLFGAVTGKLLVGDASKMGPGFIERQKSPKVFWFTVCFDFAMGIVFVSSALAR